MMKLIHSFDLEVLQENISAKDCDAGHHYLLLDGVLKPKLLHKLNKTGLPWLSVFTQSQNGPVELMAASPLLLEWFPSYWLEICKLLEFCDGLPMVSVWHSPEELPQLAARLYPWCVVDADGSFFNLRYPDTRRLLDLDRILNEEQRGQFFGPAWHCLLPNRNGKGWLALEMARFAGQVAEKVALSTSQTRQLIRGAETDEVLYQLHFHSRINPLVLADCHPATEGALLQADLLGVTDGQARMARCLDAIQAGG
ncbi:mitochondrial ribosomal protein L55-like protein [Pseudogulbenkiania sp. NH8B]|uniref:DUF4123 domain-containing protein n=1 Tax=Pseudogulbenkiania sp. (strain NH8B) TaxID=748280 RepID=UPI0002279C80|nr:DUF4123 domain-containing protein [Pseudogulbenkiania sp. NH8B]BAK75953.1 mitochondrial ribosomal protein L55-like protein [Pseudogulbenkiania sp. NH8B]